MSRPRLADLFCGAGPAAMGYWRAGYDIVGVDIEPRPNYPFPFVQADALHLPFDLSRFDAVHASPPCQLHSTLRTGVTGAYRDLIEPTRALLRSSGLPYVIENVVGAPLIDAVMLCGSSLGCVDGDAELRRHRLFETNWHVWAPPRCNHRRRVLGVYGDLAHNDRPSTRGVKAGKARARRLMGVDWPITDRELAESVPPAYTEFIGAQLLQHVRAAA